MSFTTGEQVHVAVFGKGIVREVRNGRRYLVEVRGLAMVVEERQLTRVQQPKHVVRARPTPLEAGVPERLKRAHCDSAVDLHGMTVEEALAAIDAFLNDAILAGLEEVQVIHGRSGGRLKAALHRRLQMLTSVRGFRLDPANPGMTRVKL